MELLLGLIALGCAAAIMAHEWFDRHGPLWPARVDAALAIFAIVVAVLSMPAGAEEAGAGEQAHEKQAEQQAS